VLYGLWCFAQLRLLQDDRASEEKWISQLVS
jgi:hypothetical protein